jgi:hypothetical protein
MGSWQAFHSSVAASGSEVRSSEAVDWKLLPNVSNVGPFCRQLSAHLRRVAEIGRFSKAGMMSTGRPHPSRMEKLPLS